MKLSVKDRRRVAAWMIGPLPGEVRRKLMQDCTLMKRLNLHPEFALPVGAYLVKTESLHDAQRKAIAGRKLATLELNNDTCKRAKLSRRSGTAILTIDGHAFGFSDSDLLSKDKSRRVKALRRVLKQRPLPSALESQWRDTIRSRALGNQEFVTLCTEFAATPESFSAQIAQTTNLDSDALLPNDPSYFDRLIAPVTAAKDFEAFIQGPLASTRAELLAGSLAVGLRRIAYSALWRPLIPFELFRSLRPADVEPLLAAADPFSLLCGFEICGDGLSRDLAAFSALGARFLEKLFDKNESASRYNLFATFAMITTVNIRRAVNPPDAPLWWIRLAALSHAGVLTNAKAGMPKSEEFLKWAANIFGPNYVWTTVIDLHNAPRWRPEWIDPSYLATEVVGRVIAAVSALSIRKLPRGWKRLLDRAIADLKADGRLIATQFAGPFDDFRDSAMPCSSTIGAFVDIEKALETATQLDEVPGLFSLIAASRPSEKIVTGIQRLLTKPADEPTSGSGELNYLKIACRIGASAHNTAIGDAIIRRCIAVARQQTREGRLTDILEVMLEAAAAYAETSQYRKQVGDAVAAICLAADEKNILRDIITICDTLCIRDERLTPALAKATAIARVKAGSGNIP
jgi:hypothetical protein